MKEVNTVMNRQKERSKVLASLEEEREEILHEEEVRKDLVFVEERIEKEMGYSGLTGAHRLYLYGRTSGPRRGVPVTNLKILRNLTGVRVDVLQRHSKSWNREAMRLAREMSPMHRFACSPEARRKHDDDLQSMRDQIERMEIALEGMEVGTRVFIETTKVLNMVRKEWQDASGVSSGVRVTEAALKLEAERLNDVLKQQGEGEQGPVEIDGDVFDI